MFGSVGKADDSPLGWAAVIFWGSRFCREAESRSMFSNILSGFISAFGTEKNTNTIHVTPVNS